MSLGNILAVAGFIITAGVGWGRLDSKQTELMNWQKSANDERREIILKLEDIQGRLGKLEDIQKRVERLENRPGWGAKGRQ